MRQEFIAAQVTSQDLSMIFLLFVIFWIACSRQGEAERQKKMPRFMNIHYIFYTIW